VIPSPPTEQGTATPEAVTGQASNDVDIPPSQPEETYTSQEVQPLASEEMGDPINEPAEITTAPTFTAPTEPVELPAETEFIRPVEADASPQIEQAPAPVVGQIEPGLGNFQPFTIQDLAQVAGEAVSYQLASKKIALVLSGGGARGAFQVGAEKYAREAKGYHWNIIAGVSVGAMNGAMLAMHRYDRLLEIWQSISNDQVYTGGFNLLSLVKIVFGARSFYGNGPLQKLMQGEFAAGRIIEDLRVGAVSLVSGRYVQFTKESLELSKAILASASIPVVWPPVDVSSDDVAMVDGGVRNITPVGDVLALEPDEIVIINCGNARPPATPGAAANVLSIGMRTLDIMQNEIFINDMKEFLRINALVREAEQQGVVLHHPKTGRPLKYYPCQVIEPDDDLGEVLDFSQGSVQASLRAGVRRAREVLGRP
jgi:NTE family protein